MREVTRELIRDYRIKEIGSDFLGYEVNESNYGYLTFHHTLIERQYCKELGIAKEGYLYENGSIILAEPHSYLHLIKAKDYDRYDAITSEIIDMKVQGYIELSNLMYIDGILRGFEREYSGKRGSRGNYLIKEGYTRRLIKK